MWEDITDQVLIKFQQNLIQAVVGSMRSEVLLIVLGTRTNCLNSENYPLITNAIHQTALSIVIAHHCCQLHTKFNQPSSVTVNCNMKIKLKGINIFDFFNKVYNWINREVFCNIHWVWYPYNIISVNKISLYVCFSTVQVVKISTHFLLRMAWSKEILYCNWFSGLL